MKFLSVCELLYISVRELCGRGSCYVDVECMLAGISEMSAGECGR